jgi:hypothetical protein
LRTPEILKLKIGFISFAFKSVESTTTIKLKSTIEELKNTPRLMPEETKPCKLKQNHEKRV